MPLFNKRDWQFTQASCPETGFLRACKHCRIGISRIHCQNSVGSQEQGGMARH